MIGQRLGFVPNFSRHPQGPQRRLPLPMGGKTFHNTRERMEEATGKGKEIEDSSSQQLVPWKEIGRG
jgi:hypothetical protein